MQSPPPCRGAGSNRRATPRMLRQWIAAAWLSGAVLSASSQADTAIAPTDPQNCRSVRLSDIGWTDVTATTAIFSALLKQLGYEPKTTVLSVPVTFASMKNSDIDVFLGNWMPAQAADRKPFVDDGSVDVIGANLLGAKYTLAVPAYTYDAGLQGLHGHSALRRPAQRFDLRHRARQRRQPARAGDASSRINSAWAASN